MDNKIVTANNKIENIQTHLKQLVNSYPDLEKNEQWAKITQELKHLSQSVNRQELLLETAAAISNTVNSSLNMDNLLNVSINLIIEHFNFYYVGIFLIDQTNKWAELKADNSRIANNKLQEKYCLEIEGETTIGRAINYQQVYTTDIESDTPHFENADLPDARSETVIPLITRAEVIGALVLQSTEQTAFSNEDVYSLQTLGDQLANAIQNVALFANADRQLEQLVALHNINLQLDSHLNVDTLLDDVAQLSTKLLNADASIIRLIDVQKELFTIKAAYNLPKGIELGQTEEFNADLNSTVVQTRQAILANDWPAYALAKGYAIKNNDDKAPDTLAILNAPIAVQNKIIGTIEVHSFTRLQAFDENDLYTLPLLASQAATAIEKTQLFNQAENNQRFLKTVIEHIPDPIFIKDREHTWIEMNQANAKVIGKPEEELIGKTDRLYFSPELANEFYRRDDEVFATNKIFEYEDKTVWGDDQEHIAYTRLIPIPDTSGQPEYLLGITNDITERKAHEAERERFLTETSALYKGSQTITGALSEFQIFDALFEQIGLENPCEISIFRFKMVKDEPIWAKLKANWQKQDNHTYRIGSQLYLPETPHAKLITTNTPLFIEDIATDTRLSEAEREGLAPTEAVSVAILPLTFIGQELGSVIIYFTTPRTFSETTRRFWLAMAEQAGVALHNRQLIQEAAYRAVQMETAAEVARSASTLLGLDDLLNSAVALIRDRFEPYYVGAFLMDKTGEWAVLRAGTGEAGRILLEHKYRLKIDKESMIGWSIHHRQPRIALDVGKDAIHFQNPYLPYTRSEMTLPLIHRNKAIGALTVQSDEQAAFSQTDIIFLQTMADQLANAVENARLFEQAQQEIGERKRAEDALRQALERTESLYRIGDTIATSTDQQTTFETVLGEYLRLLTLKWGGLSLLNKAGDQLEVRAMYRDGKPIQPDISNPTTTPLFQHLLKNPGPLVIGDVYSHPLTKDTKTMRGKLSAKSMLYVPLVVRGQVMGIIAAGSTEKNYSFSDSDVETGQAVTDQLAIWLENQQLLAETQYRSDRLQTAAEVSGAASSILDVGELIDTSVNLIRDQFNFYYVGLFMIDEAGEWAVLRAGTGKAGRVQLKKNHRLKIGGESMIGWSMANRKARIALDVGEEAVRFQNPHLPDTRSEMALPLISRDKAIGALTVQSTEPGAFSEEDITLLQTMADQLANAIENARLFENADHAQKEAEAHLQETLALQKLSQNLAGTLQVSEIINTFFKACTEVLGFDFVIFSLVDKYQHRVKAIDGVGVTNAHLKRANHSMDSQDIMVDIVQTGKTDIITGWDERFDPVNFEAEEQDQWGMRIFTPITLRQENIGLVEAGFNKNTQALIQDSQVRLLRAFIDQTALAMDNAQRYEASQRAARREALIKEITTKVRASTDLDTILQTTVKEVGDAISSRRAYIHLVPQQRTTSPQEKASSPGRNGNPLSDSGRNAKLDAAAEGSRNGGQGT